MENDRLKKAQTARISLKVSEKGAISLYGLGRFPFTAYRQQWEKILSMADQIKAFIEANKDKLAA